MNQPARWPAKLLLFGEYSILLGSSALGIPFNRFSTALQAGKQGAGSDEAAESNLQLKGLFEFFMLHEDQFGEFLDLDKFRMELQAGIWLSSSIPQRYGLGSSGSLCAAVYDRYHLANEGSAPGEDPGKIALLRSRFILMESFFHGMSSGFDPLVIYLRRPLLLEGDHARPVSVPGLEDENGLSILLVGSGVPCSTGPRVMEFMKQFAPGGRVTAQGHELILLTNSAIEWFLAGRSGEFFRAVGSLSAFQPEIPGDLVPANLLPCWREGLSSGMFSMKLCGSGGGGFILCFTHDRIATEAYFRERGIQAMLVTRNT